MSRAQAMTEREPRRSPATMLRAAAVQLRRLLVLLLILSLLGVALVAIATALQAQRDEARRADLLVVIAPAVPSPAFIDHTFELYRRGYAPRLIVAGSGRAQLIGALGARGLPAEVLDEAARAELPLNQIATAAQAAQGAGGASALVVAQQEELLLSMKIVRDMGLRTYGSPPPGRSVDPLALLEASADYWGYVLLRR